MTEVPVRITGCILARNEEARLDAALASLRGWVDQLLVIDHGSTDGTAAVARAAGAEVLLAGAAEDYDQLRNVAVEHATGEWLFYLDADERVPDRLAAALPRLLRDHGAEFAALYLPFRHHFCGHWLRHRGWWPGYTRPQLLKRGCFQFQPGLHCRVQVSGTSFHLPASDPELALLHHPYPDLEAYMTRLNAETDREARALRLAGAPATWEAHLAHFVRDWQAAYERGEAAREGLSGFVLSFLTGFYGFACRAKLWDLHRQSSTSVAPGPLPASVGEMLQFMARVEREGAAAWLTADAGEPLPGDPLPSGWLDLKEADETYLTTAEAEEEGLPRTPGITACILARNEERRIEAALQSLAGWVDQILVIDDGSTDRTVEIARQYGAEILPAACALNFDAVRNLAIEHAQGDWIYYLDADERVPAALARTLRSFLAEHGERYAAVSLPFKHHFYGKWMESGVWWPSYCRPQLVKKGRFQYGERIHSGVFVDGETCFFPDDPDRAVRHHSYDDVAHYYRKLNHYTSAEAENALRDGCEATWQHHLADFITDWHIHYDRGGAVRDGMHGFVQSFHCAFYRFLARAKIWDRRQRQGERCGEAPPLTLRELLQFMHHVYAEAQGRQDLWRPIPRRFSADQTSGERDAGNPILARDGSAPPAIAPQGQRGAVEPPIRLPAQPVVLDPPRTVDLAQGLGRPLRVCWEGDFSLRSSLALVNRELCLELLRHPDVELSLREQVTPWHTLKRSGDRRWAPLFARLEAELSGPPDVTIRHGFPPRWERPDSGKLVVMQPWEYGSLPQDWLEQIGRVDEVWAYSRWVRDVYIRSGVPAEKVRLVPLGARSTVFRPGGRKRTLPTEKTLRFLFVGGAIPRKGADLLLEAYRRAFSRADDVCLVVKGMGTETFYGNQSLAARFQAAANDPTGPEVLYLEEDLSDSQLAALYRACDCVVLPYRGEGFGLAPLEGMACGLPAIVTAGGATEDYVDDTTALRVPSRRVSVGRVEQYTCVGEPWVLEPDLDALVDASRWVREHPEETRARGASAAASAAGWSWERSGGLLRERLAHLTRAEESAAGAPVLTEAAGSGRPRGKMLRRGKRGSISLCMIARDEESRIGAALAGIAPFVDELIVVDTGSTDRTREVARECGARVYDLPWPESFAAARNASLELARGQWLFWMDADDVISPEVGAALRELVAAHPKADAAFQVQVRIPPGAGEFSPTLVDHVKLFPNRPELRFEHRIHEQILPSLRRAGVPVHFSPLYVTHQNYDRSPEGQAKKRQRDFHLLELDLRDRPDHPFVLFNLGMTHLYATKDWAVAVQYLRRCLERSHPGDSIVRKAYALLTTSHMGAAEWSLALAANEAGRSFYPDDAELLFQAGQLYQRAGRLEHARAALERLVRGGDDPHYRSVDVGLRAYRGKHELGLLLCRMGDPATGERLLREVVAEAPHYAPAALDLQALREAQHRPSG